MTQGQGAVNRTWPSRAEVNVKVVTAFLYAAAWTWRLLDKRYCKIQFETHVHNRTEVGVVRYAVHPAYKEQADDQPY